MMQVYAFVAPKIIGGEKAPSPVGELGMVQMSQALKLTDVSFEQVRVEIVILFYNLFFAVIILIIRRFVFIFLCYCITTG